MTSSQRSEELVKKVVAKLAPYIDVRCKSCGGTGIAIRSQLDCTPCGGSGLDHSLGGDEVAALLAKDLINLISAGHVLARMDDAAETQAILVAATTLCQDSLGDDRLWAATTPLRDALTTLNISDRDGQQP